MGYVIALTAEVLRCEWVTCRSSVESLVSGLVLPLRTISVRDMNPDAESTSTPSTSSFPAPDTLKWILLQDHLLYKGSYNRSQQEVGLLSSNNVST